MSKVVIKVEDLSKQYRLGEIGTGSLAHDINRWWYNVRGKEDPYLKIGETNDRTKVGNSQYVWSLKDIDFSIKQGDAVGIIGRNGAGKSTLLKVLSRVTAPTTGSVKVKGRIASLLEVGTGFHPDLSGRDNIFLNGAILGMRKDEIKRKFDEIVDFAGVERYVDTPVKRYSSGMYVRLAFAVAAHLESEILIVDEVLAVGDSEFQKKCLGKMDDVSKGEGRTVLFVSHNMASIKNLCTSGIYLKNGGLEYSGGIDEAIAMYSDFYANNLSSEYDCAESKKPIHIKHASLRSNGKKVSEVDSTMANLELYCEIQSNIQAEELMTGFTVYDSNGLALLSTSHFKISNFNGNVIKAAVQVPLYNLKPGAYYIDGGVWNKDAMLDLQDHLFSFKVVEEDKKNKESKGIILVPDTWSHVS
jgi:lipopolysaccharide transport system ATP-binding protein